MDKILVSVYYISKIAGENFQPLLFIVKKITKALIITTWYNLSFITYLNDLLVL